MKIAIVGINFQKDSVDSVRGMMAHLRENGDEIFIADVFFNFLKSDKIIPDDYPCTVFHKGDELDKIDFFFSVGGDGTFLETITYVGKKETPVLGINTGRMGFLATIQQDEIIKAIENLRIGNYTIDKRSLIEVEMENNVFSNTNFALNEISVSKRDTSSMITIHTKIDGEFLNVYWADGLIISTPTGSTGYSLSCGGPIMMPSTSNFIIAPINPHNLTQRPLVVSDESEIELYVETRSKNYLITLDSRSKPIDKSIRFKVKKATFQVKLVNVDNNTYIKTLKNKLNWGVDVRN